MGRLLEARGFQVLDVDKLGHRALDEQAEAVAARFGAGMLDEEGKVDRRALGRAVFGDDAALADLEAIVHPAANRLTEQWIEERPGADLVINAALLHRSSAFARCSPIILVRAPYPVRLWRARTRDRLAWAELFRRFRSQKNFEAQYFSRKADIQIVDNGGFPLAPTACAARKERALERSLDAIFARKGTDR